MLAIIGLSAEMDGAGLFFFVDASSLIHGPQLAVDGGGSVSEVSKKEPFQSLTQRRTFR